MSDSYQKLLEKNKMITALNGASGWLQWDQEVMMPPSGGDARAEEMRALALVTHEKSTDPKIGELLSEVVETPENAPHIREMRREYEHATKLPASLVGELTALTSRAQGIWAQARQDSDYSAFAPTLKEIIRLTRAQAQCLSEGKMSDYDALLDQYEPGMTTSELDQYFKALEAPLVELSQAISQAPAPQSLTGDFNLDAQLDLSRFLMRNMGFEENWSRLDQSTHPFSAGNFDDCRITTRLDISEPLGCIYSTLHEMGHALYEHGIDRNLQWMPAGIFASMGVHESQSRFVENQIGRGKAYVEWLYPIFKSELHDGGLKSANDFYKAINRVERGFIRTEADEVHYNLHVLLRYQLERDLISGDLSVDDLEGVWNERFKALLGLDVPNAAMGVLQDVHWSSGAFGYFPTYSLGNIYAASLSQKLREEAPNLDAEISQGQHATWQNWMKENIHQHGRLIPAQELVEKATGEKPTAQPLIDYLREKFGAIYGL